MTSFRVSRSCIRDYGVTFGYGLCALPLRRVKENPNNVEYACDENLGKYIFASRTRKVGRPRTITIDYAVDGRNGVIRKKKKIKVNF